MGVVETGVSGAQAHPKGEAVLSHLQPIVSWKLWLLLAKSGFSREDNKFGSSCEIFQYLYFGKELNRSSCLLVVVCCFVPSAIESTSGF